MSSDELAVVIGATRKERVPALVAAHAMAKRSSIRLRFVHTYERTFPCPPGPTGFSFQRFAVPELVDRKGKVLYIDSDMIALGDVAELAALPMGGAHVLCSDPQAAVMLINAETAPWSLESVTSALKTLQHKKVMDLRDGLSNAKVVRSIPSAWNSLDVMQETSKLLHYTNMTTQPWLAARPHRHRFADVWFKELRDAVKDKAVLHYQVKHDVLAKHIHTECLEVLQ